MSRPSFESIYINLAVELSKRSTCSRLQVGCVVTSADYTQVLGVGYNGGARGQKNCCDTSEPGNCGCLHSEDNCLIKVSSGPEVPKIMFVTHMPCSYCAKRIVNKGGFQRVYYKDGYRSEAGKEILSADGIEVIQF